MIHHKSSTTEKFAGHKMHAGTAGVRTSAWQRAQRPPANRVHAVSLCRPCTFGHYVGQVKGVIKTCASSQTEQLDALDS